MNQCYLPAGSSISELNFSVTNEIDKVYLFDSKVKKQIEIILGETYLLPEVLEAFKSFSEALAPLVNPSLEFDEGQVKVKDMNDKFDIYDNPIVTFSKNYGGGTFYLNKPGASEQDILQGISQTLQYIPGMGLVQRKVGGGIIRKASFMGLAGGGTSVLQDVLWH